MKYATTLAALAVLSLSAPAAAQEPITSISAGKPAELTVVMMNAGYTVELAEDGIGDPMIISELIGMPLRIYFYGCDEEDNSGCTSLQLSTGFDRRKPWSRGEALQISEQLRYAAVRLDEEGDPFISWDIYTGDGIPTTVFLASLDEFARTIQLTADIVFAEEEQAKK
ncbi:YbjN domain-containing protein [Qipengyuania nanhaisediminis]|uniref:YbjN domain-containing protein n=1 Tax=Qipengyuania nanhaisediminis TaxID=604088 RepID=UPI0038B3B7F6